MSHYRSEFRTLARDALVSHARFSIFTAPKVWPGVVDAASLPVIGVLTPDSLSVLAQARPGEQVRLEWR